MPCNSSYVDFIKLSNKNILRVKVFILIIKLLLEFNIKETDINKVLVKVKKISWSIANLKIIRGRKDIRGQAILKNRFWSL
jgi:hypothetical protein